MSGGYRKRGSKPKAFSSGLITGQDLNIHFKRTLAQLSVSHGLDAPAEVHEARLILNEINAKGVHVFISRPLSPGQEVSLLVQEPKKFFVTGQVTSCQEIFANNGILTERTFHYRIEMTFIFKTDAEKDEVKNYCEFLAKHYLGFAKVRAA
jgi:hypothetical protein